MRTLSLTERTSYAEQKKELKHIKNEKWERIYEEKNRKKDIVGGFNPFDKFFVKIGIFPK